MKRFCWVWVFLWGVLIAPSCGNEKDDPIPEKPIVAELSASPVSLSFEAVGGQKSISINSNTNWRITFSGIDWVRPSISSSQGDVTVQVSADTNEEESERTATFTVTAEGANDVIITISQMGKEAEEQEPEFECEAYIEPDNSEMRDVTSLELSTLMGVGWNLGNSLEAISVTNGNYSGGETSWGNPATTKTFVDAVKNAGFKSIRIPVSWSHKLVDKETFQISVDWLERVAEVVNYALDNDLFVMMNIHWDGGWMDYPDYQHQDQINTKLAALWQQIACYFRDYDDRLLFAGTNEVHVVNDYGNPTAEQLAVQNSFNQTFVTTVRETGGRNHYRHLIVQGYNTNITYTNDGFVMPNDVIENRLMVEVHYYDPYEFALKEDAPFKTQWGEPYAGGDVTNWGQEAWANEAFGMMKTKFIDKGVAVIIGEYGAIHRTNLIGEAYNLHKSAREYYLKYITQVIIQKGMVPVYWDNGSEGNNGFALFNRSTGAVVDQGALDAIMIGAGVL